ncbi:MAG: DUF167 domain-containing protein [Candidatus Omnitrophota bacterium]
MKINIKVKPNSSREKIERLAQGQFILWVKAPAKEGKANEAALKLLSAYFDIPKSRFMIIRGNAARDKLVEII